MPSKVGLHHEMDATEPDIGTGHIPEKHKTFPEMYHNTCEKSITADVVKTCITTNIVKAHATLCLTYYVWSSPFSQD